VDIDKRLWCKGYYIQDRHGEKLRAKRVAPHGRTYSKEYEELNTGMRRITTFRSTTDRIYDSGPI